MTGQQQQQQEAPRDSARDAARDALVSSLVIYGVQAAFLLALTAGVSKRYWLDHARWRYERWRGRADRLEAAAMAEVRRDISRLEHGESMPAPRDRGLYGGLL